MTDRETIFGQVRMTGLTVPNWLLSVLSGLVLALTIGSITLIFRFITLETQVNDNKEDRQKQFQALERRMERELDDLDAANR